MKYFLIILSILSFSIISLSQTIVYSYDNAGNREMRYPIEGLVQNNDEVGQAINNHSPITTSELNEILTLGKEELSLAFFPNPAVDHIRVDVQSGESELINIQIFNSSGKLMIFENISGASTEVKVSQLASGSYLLKARASDETFEWRFIKQ